MMDIKAFGTELRRILKAYLGSEYEIEFRDIPKLNTGTHRALYIRKGKSDIFSCIYPETYFPEFERGRSLTELANNILSVVKGGKAEHKIDDFYWLSDWEQVKDRLSIRLVNPIGNDAILKDGPTVPFLNLCCVFCVEAFQNADGIGQARVSNKLMDAWDQMPESLFCQAVKNIDRAGIKLSPLWDVVKSFFPTDSTSVIGGISSSPIYMLTDAAASAYGASVIVSEIIRRDICQQFHQDMYVLPSSVHELLLVPADNKASPYELLRLVREVNQSAVHKSDWLADNVYLLRASDASVSVVA